jgi:hypothetical protein
MSEKIGDGLVRIGAMSCEQKQEGLRRQNAGDHRLFGEIAIELGFINDEALQSYLGIKPQCRFRTGCHFYAIRDKAASTERLQELYCANRPVSCAIYQRKSGGKPVPIDLWPTGKIAV